MKIVLYEDTTKKVLELIEGIENPQINGQEIKWDGGGLGGLNSPFLLLSNDAEVPETVTEELISQDKKTEYNSESEQLRQTIVEMQVRHEAEKVDMQLAIAELADLVTGGA